MGGKSCKGAVLGSNAQQLSLIRSLDSSRPRTMNNKGIVDEYRRPKLAYEAVKKIFREAK